MKNITIADWRDSYILDNYCSGDGGFIYMQSGTLAINWVHFDGTKTTGSHAHRGGCIDVHDGKVTIKESTFEGFRASNYGGAMYVYKTTTAAMTIESTTFKDNEATVRLIFADIHKIYTRSFYSVSYFFVIQLQEIKLY